MRYSIAVAILLVGTLGTAAFAQSTRQQQEKDLEQKQRIYGVKYPWQNTAPYGTQYTPPAGGAEPPATDEPSSADKKPEAKPSTAAKKVKAKSTAKKHSVSAKTAKAAKTTKNGK